MFGKEGTTEAQGAISTILGHDCKFTGDIDAKGSVRIDGDFEGKMISSDSVIVGKGGMVRARSTPPTPLSAATSRATCSPRRRWSSRAARG